MTATFTTSAHADIGVVRDWIFRRMLQVIDKAKTGHLGACCSSTDLLTVLYFGDVLRYDSENARHPLRDYVINRGHLGPLKYTIGALIGWLEEDELDTYRQYGSRLAGHEDMRLTPGIDVSPNGSLGMILSYAVGLSIGFRDAKMPNRVWCFLGDGEEQEGNVSEAARHAAHIGAKNLITVIDKNGGQLSTRTSRTDSSGLKDIWQSYGWEVIVVDGHNPSMIKAAYDVAQENIWQKPVCIIANTIKGYGIPGAEHDYCGYHVYHGGSEPGETVRHTVDLKEVIAELPNWPKPYIAPKALPIRRGDVSDIVPHVVIEKRKDCQQYDVEQDILLKLKEDLGDRLYILTSDYPPRCFVYSTHSPLLDQNYYNVGIREQHMTAMAHGIMQARPDALVAVLCGDAFLYRHMDQMNALAQAHTRVVFFSVQAGLSGARNGETHQSSGQPGALLMMPGMHVEEPCTGEDMVHAVNRATLRRAPTVVRLQKLRSPWSFGGACDIRTGYEVVHYHPSAIGTLIACGKTSIEAHMAMEKLMRQKIEINFISITCLSECQGFSQWVLPEKPIFGFYNGNPRVLEDVILHELNDNELDIYGKVHVKGFTFGRTGGIGDLLRHFGLNEEAIRRHVLEIAL